MRVSPTLLRVAAAGLLAALPLLGALPAAAQTQHDHSKPAAASTASIQASTISAVQQALNGQGIAVKVDGVLGEDTRAAIRAYQTQHHLPVTGEPDAATLEKLGVTAGASAAAPQAKRPMMGGMAQGGMMQGGMARGGAAQGSTSPGRSAQGGMMNCSMMQGDMKQMAQMMQQMSQKMQAMEQRMQGMPSQPPKPN